MYRDNLFRALAKVIVFLNRYQKNPEKLYLSTVGSIYKGIALIVQFSSHQLYKDIQKYLFYVNSEFLCTSI